MRINYLMPTIENTGGVQSALKFISGLSDRGHYVNVFVLKSDRVLREVIKDRLKRFFYRDRICLRNKIDIQLKFIDNIEGIEVSESDIIIAHGMRISHLLQISGLRNGKLLQFIHGEHVADVQMAKAVMSSDIPKIVVSPHLERKINSLGGRVIGVVPNGVEDRFFRTSIKNDSGYIGSIYSPHPAKNPGGIKKTFEVLHNSGLGYKLLAFSTSKKPKDFKTHIYKRCPSETEVLRLYNACKYWLVLSRSEGFSMPVLEAMASGCVVISTRCGGPEELIKSGENGILVNVDDNKSIVKAIRILENDHILLEKFVANGRLTAKEYSWVKSVDSLIRALGVI